MADLSRVFFWKHLRAESSSTILHFSGGKLVRSGAGLTFWFWPLSSSIAELPRDDAELTVLFKGTSADFQEVTTEAVLTWRVTDPALLASRIDFTVDLNDGRWKRQPIERVGTLLTQLAQQMVLGWMARQPLATILSRGVEEVRERVDAGLRGDPGLQEMGIGLVSVRIAAIRASAEVERALQTPTREGIQQEADKATFERRALAVERERAIAENELQNRIELARREEVLIAQQGQNERRRATDAADAKAIEAKAAAERASVEATSKAEAVRLVEGAQAEAEQQRVAIYQSLDPAVLLALAAKEVAGHLPPIEHLTIGADALGPALTRLAEAGSRRLKA